MHKLSIVTITLNSEKYLEQTIKSVARQTYPNIEYILIDGGSTDQTVDIITEHEAQIDKWISEPDTGIADAMNKGLRVATGDYILFLHSDDYLLDANTIERIAPLIDTGKDMYLFSIFRAFGKKLILSKPRGLNPWINFKTGVWHQGAICSRNLFERIGEFDTSFTIAMDYDFFLRAYREKASSLIINMPLSVMRMIGVSARQDWSTLQIRFNEERIVHRKNCNSALLRAIYQLYWFFYMPYRLTLHTLRKQQKV